MILNILCYPIHLILRFMNLYLRISTRYRIYLSILLLFFKYRPLPHTNRQLNTTPFTFNWSDVVCGDNIFSLNLFYYIINSKSISTSLPLSAFCFFRIYLTRLAYSILILLSSLFFSIFFIYYK